MQFVRETLSGQQNQIINQQSPLQVQQNQLMLTTFESLLAMLNAMSDSVGVVANNLVLLGNWQNAYTQMLSKVPTYVGGTSSAVVIPTQGVTSGDLNLLTFGYGNISAQDIANWAAAQLQGTGTTPVTFQMNIDTSSSSAIAQTLSQLSSLAGPNANISNVLTQIGKNSFFQVTVDPSTKKVTFNVSGVNLQKFANEPASDPAFGSAGAPTNLSNHISFGAESISNVGYLSGGSTVAIGTQTVPLGGLYQTGSASTTTANTNAYAVQTSNSSVTVSSSNFNNAVSSIQGAFAQFWNSTQTQSISNFQNVSGIRLAVQDVISYGDVGGNSNPGVNNALLLLAYQALRRARSLQTKVPIHITTQTIHLTAAPIENLLAITALLKRSRSLSLKVLILPYQAR